MDFAFLLCGWESRSVSIQNGSKCSLRYRLSLPGVTYTIVDSICQALSSTALELLTLEMNCSNIRAKDMGLMHQTLCRAVMETIRIHRTLVLKLGTVKSLSLFVKLTRRCCGGIHFVSRIMDNITFKESGINVLVKSNIC